MTESKIDKPSYFSILTAAVRYDRNLCANAKLLYSEITCLTQKEGYCWASNKYFSELYEVDVSTVKRWISKLEVNGHISIVTEKDGMRWDRKIYPKNVYEGSKISLPKAQKEAYRGLKNEPILKQEFNREENNNKEPPAVASQAVVVLSIFNELDIPESLKKRLSSQMDSEKADKLVQRVKAWKSKGSDAIGCNTILRQWDTWSDKDSIADREEKIEEETNIRKSNAEKRKERALNIKNKTFLSMFTVRDEYIDRKTGRNGVVKVGVTYFCEDEMDKLLDCYDK